MEENNTHDYTEKDYKGKVEVIFSKMIPIDTDKPELLNGFSGKFDVYEKFRSDKKIAGKKATPELKFNYPDSNLYVIIVYHFDTALTLEELDELRLYSEEAIKKNSINTTKEVGTIYLNSKEDTFIKQGELEPPKGFLFLDSMLTDDKEKAAYTQFLNNKLMFERLLVLCKKLKLEVTKEMITGVMLPVHGKHKQTSTMLVHKDVSHLFDMFQLAQNFVTFPEDTSEYAVGISMMHDVKFNDYVLKVARKQEKTKVDIDPDRFSEEYNKSIKRIQKKEIVK